ncbi:putative SbcD/Mre11-related phosphoesterase/DNA ligase-associated metallophosphoesterase [Dyadobacter jejuensis]|uniref:Putative SbcD/Mre11-related phosphoesterase/DNA ligase-associated metallophosphoesterase n=1 Tax=Dyadobacter jejuensis TaxID=1082580 RepID=A0A316AQI0_9BACT|nr:ligase-associated DNA damage response endonuclease PdeM [Dyadobacter jejuensis]PWJ59539.1 putative SbcD/Mre11-related phosphoesterase/DNA ligase-associated metallophosphoesterase [Dyadobacter jejuensis]
MKIRIHDNDFTLLVDKAIFWEDTHTLLIGDLHLGKIAHFRKEGIAVPPLAAEDNFKRLTHLLTRTKARRIIFLGDLFHSKHNSEWEAFLVWRETFRSTQMVMVKGNHDSFDRSFYEQANLEVYEAEYVVGPFVFTHFPKTEWNQDQFVFCGHIHPVFLIVGRGRQHFSSPCFVVDPYQAILPSFGVFTGGHRIAKIRDRRIFMLTHERVFEVSNR